MKEVSNKFYKAEPRFWFLFLGWRVVDESGEVIVKGSELLCTVVASRLNAAWDHGYAKGRRDEYIEAKREISKYQ